MNFAGSGENFSSKDYLKVGMQGEKCIKTKTGLNLRQINALTAWTLNLISEQYPAE